jgi:Tol biopolymer transport system component
MPSTRHLFADRTYIMLATVVALSSVQTADAAFPGSNGLIAFASDRDGNFEIYVMNPDGTNQANITNNFADDTHPSWAPDGSRIAFSSNRDGNSEIYVVNADGSNLSRITDRTSATDISPVWSPDGLRIAFASFDCCPAGANYDIWVMNADGTDQVNITNHPAEDIYPAWQPGGATIAFQTNRDGNAEIYSMSPDGTGLANLTNSSSFEEQPDWSPDGSMIAFATDRAAIGFGVDVYLMNSIGGGVMPVTGTHADSMPSWSPDGTKVVFRSFRDLNDEIYTINVDGTAATRLTNNALPGNTLPQDWFPDWQPVDGGSTDTTPPTITCNATPEAMWPPNHTMREVSVDVSATDDSGSVAVRLVSVTSNQDNDGAARQDRLIDATGWDIGSDDRAGFLRAERLNQDRTYVLTYEASDASNNTALCQATVVVRRDQRPD